MTSGRSVRVSRSVEWSGWVLAGVFALTPLLAWVGPLAFAVLAAVAGLSVLPLLKVRDEDRAAAIGLLVIIIWSVGSAVWSPFKPESLEGATAAKMIGEAVLYGALVSASRVALDDQRTIALRILAWGMAALGVLLALEALSGASVYQGLRIAMGDPIRPDLAVKNIAQGGFVLTLLAPAAILAAVRTERAPWLGVPMVAGVIGIAVAFGYDALLIALLASAAAAGVVYAWPRIAPRVLAGLAAAFFLGAPVIVAVTRANGLYGAMESSVPLSWAMRMGYWKHAADWIGDHPLRGWGLDASRMFAPGIQLHPHNAALQIWLELGLIGAMGAAVFFAATLANLSHSRRDLGAAVAAATVTAYLTFSAFSFGVWQEWWLALGAIAASACFAVIRQPSRAAAKSRSRKASAPSTPPVFSE